MSSPSRGSVAWLDLEIRRLTAKLRESESKLTNAEFTADQLKSAFSAAMVERENLLASKSWQLARAIQKAASIARWILSMCLRRQSFSPDLMPTPLLAASDQTSPTGSIPDKPLTYQEWAQARGHLSPMDRERIIADIARFTNKPLISLLVRDNGADRILLEQTLKSIRDQLYTDWEICLRSDKKPNGSLLVILDAGALLPVQALYKVVQTFENHPEVDIVFTDEDQIDVQGHFITPILKPDFSIDLQLAYHLTGALTVYRRSVLDLINVSPLDATPEEEQEFVLQVALRSGATAIKHIPEVLCHRISTSSTAGSNADLTIAKDRLAAVMEQIAPLKITPLSLNPQWNRITWPLPNTLPRVSVIVPTRDRGDLLARCVLGLLYRTDYSDLEILILDNESTDVATLSLFCLLQTDARVRVISVPGAFNYSALNNLGARQATGDVLLLLNNDVEVIEPGWLKEMVSHAIRPDVGAVGAKLLYQDGSVQHAGVVLGVGQHNAGPGVAGHFGLAAEPDDLGYLGQFALTRELSAVTGACLALRRDVYEAVGGLDDRNLAISFNDVDLCLRIRATGLRIVWTPFAMLYHLESASRGQPKTPEQIQQAAMEADFMRLRWGSTLDRDPFYNPAFDRKSHAFEFVQPTST